MRRGGSDPFFNFGDPFAGFGGFGGFSGFGGQGRPQSLISSFFGGRDPFDDPFFTRPFGGMFESNFRGPSVDPFVDMRPSGFIEHQTPEPRRSRGPIIEEINSDDENEEEQKEKKGNLGKHGRSSDELDNENSVEDIERRRNRQIQCMNDNVRVNNGQRLPQTRSYSFQSSTVTYGGHNGAYYTSSKTRRTGSDGVTIEENREANSATREATHRLLRGLHNKGHTVTRKLNSDGRVDTMQTLHNLNEDELTGFEQAWRGNACNQLPSWSGSIGGSTGAGNGGSSGQVMALPSTEARASTGASRGQAGPSRRPNAAVYNARERDNHSRPNFRNSSFEG